MNDPRVSRLALLLLASLNLLPACPATAQLVLDAPRLLGDLRTQPTSWSSNPVPWAAMPATPAPGASPSDQIVYFIATDDLHSSELWQIDATGEARRVTDVCPGPCYSFDPFFHSPPVRMRSGLVVFEAQDSFYGNALWSTNGSRVGHSGLELLTPNQDFDPTSQRIDSVGEAPLGDRVYFAFRGSLWSTDGTASGTRQFAFADDSHVGQVRDIHRVGDRIVFYGDRLATGRELWSTDGTSEGVQLLEDRCPGGCSTLVHSVGAIRRDDQGVADLLVFSVETNTGIPAIVATGGTPGTTRTLLDVCDGAPCDAWVRGFGVVGDDLAFGVGGEVWLTDGTRAGTRRVGSLDGAYRVAGFGAVPGGMVAFGIRDAFTDVWFLPLAPGLQTLLATTATAVDHYGAILPDGPILFGAYSDADDSFGVWKTDGTIAGTGPLTVPGVPGLRSYPADFAPWQGSLVFSAYDPQRGQELHISDGTPEGSARFADIAGSTRSSSPREFLALGERVLFVADASSTGDTRPPQEAVGAGDLYVTTGGTPTLLLADRRARNLTRVGDRVLFSARPEPFAVDALGSGGEPWITDGTVAGTRLLADLAPGLAGSHPRDAVVLPGTGGRILFFADQGAGAKIWTTEGTPGSEKLVADIDPQWLNHHPDDPCGNCSTAPAAASEKYHETSVYPRDAHVVGDRVVFVGHDESVGEELWVTDGTAAGTAVLLDLTPGPESTVLGPLVAMDGLLYFFVEPKSVFEGAELWATDGTPEGTREIVGLGDQGITEAVVVATSSGNRLAIGTPRSLWISDGTDDGTARAGVSARMGQLTPADDGLYFATAAPPIGTRIARWDADSGLVFPVGVAGDVGSEPVLLAGLGRRLVATATTGTLHQTLLVVDPDRAIGIHVPPPTSSGQLLAFADEALVVGDRLYVAATDHKRGLEPWVLDVVPQPDPCFGHESQVCLGDRFLVSVSWTELVSGASGEARVAGSTDDTGFFWFFGADNVELAVKILDGVGINGHHWLLYGALTDVLYTIRAEDTRTGAVRTYVSTPGSLCGDADVLAFDEPSFSRVAPGAGADSSLAPRAHPLPHCGDVGHLCLQDRFDVSVTWRTDDDAGNGHPVSFSDETGMFWFFDDDNVELLVKILDGRQINGKYWVFYGALSDVEYEIRVADTVAGKVRTYSNARGNLCGGADVDAFDAFDP